MKRVWIAIVLILLCISECVFEQIYITNFCTTLDNLVEEENVDEIKDFWNEKNDTMYIFSNHEPMDELGRNIIKLDDENKKETLKEIKAINKAYYENQRVGLSNIF